MPLPCTPWAALPLACARATRAVESRRWRCLPTARGAQRAPPVEISQIPGTKTFGGARKPLQTALRAPWRPLRGTLCPSGGPGHVCGVSRTLPRPSLALPRSVFRARLGDGSRIYVRLAPARLIRPATRLRLAPRAPAKPRTTRRGEWWRLRRSSLAPSRRLLDADWRAALRRSAEASSACIRHARIAYRFWVGAQGPGPTPSKGEHHDRPTNTIRARDGGSEALH